MWRCVCWLQRAVGERSGTLHSCVDPGAVRSSGVVRTPVCGQGGGRSYHVFCRRCTAKGAFLVPVVLVSDESQIDPIDMSLYAPEITKRVQAYCNRTALLHGALSRSAARAAQASQPAEEQPPKSLLAKAPARFSVLPVPASAKPAPEKTQTMRKKRVSSLGAIRGAGGQAVQASTPVSAKTRGWFDVGSVRNQLGLTFLDNVFQ